MGIDRYLILFAYTGGTQYVSMGLYALYPPEVLSVNKRSAMAMGQWQ